MRKFGGVCLACLIVLAATQQISSAEYVLELDVPLYGQDLPFYCGAAISQMMMMGYPDPGTHKCYQQEELYGKIEQRKKDEGLFTDPDGLRDTLMEMNPPAPPGKYEIFHDVEPEVVMHDILYWMAKRRYPTATMTKAGDHWVVITGFETDSDPTQGDATLHCIYINDPDPVDTGVSDDPCTPAIEGVEGGMSRRMTGSSWYAEDWGGPIELGNNWLGEWVAVVEPPETEGRVRAPKEMTRGSVLSPDEALTLAMAYAEDAPCHAEEAFGFLADARPQDVYLVNPNDQPYYMAPLVLGSKPGSPGAILMNAYDGAFQEVGGFTRHLPYLTRLEAIDAAECSYGRTTGRPSEAELVSERSLQARNRYRPVWKVTLHLEGTGTTVRYVDHYGQVFLELTSLPMGGD